MRLSAIPAPDYRSSLMGIPSGKTGVIQTLKLMRQMVRQYKTAVPLRNFALSVVDGLANKDYPAELAKLQQWVQHNIRYVRDVNGVETLQAPDVTLSIHQGDCDDHSVLLATLLEAIGHPTRFVAVGFEPDSYEHVYVESRLGAGWVSAETTEPVGLGWQPENIQARLYIHN